MKRTLLLILIFLPMLASAQNAVEIDGIYYNLKTEEKTAEVTQGPYQYYKGDVTIPESFEYGGMSYSVTNIGSHAFIDCIGMTSITIPNSVTSMGVGVFMNCSGLTSVTIPNSVTTIGVDVFSNCIGLTSINVETGNTKYDSRDNCNAIIETESNTLIAGCKNTTIPNSVTIIGNYAFEYCHGLTSITIPNSVTIIGDYAFMMCEDLTSITIPNSVTGIGGQAFYGCRGLTSITIPISVTMIWNYAFSYCTGLTSIHVESGNTKYDSRDNCNAIIETTSNTLIAGCQNTIIPNSVTRIGVGAFNACGGLTSITIPNGVTSIGKEAFEGCISLTSITIPNSVTSIGVEAFEHCPCLLDMFCYAENVPTTGNNVFNMSNIANATLHVPAASMDAYKAVDPWKQFKVIMALDDDEMKIVKYDLEGIYYYLDTKAKTAEVTENPNEYQGDVTIPDVVKYNGITYSVTSIGFGTFWDCSGLTSITIPGSVTSIESGTFHGCSGLTSVTIGNGVTTIGVAAFEGCSALTSVTIGNSVNTIGDYAFTGCKGLTSVTIPDGVTSIGNCTFGYCSSLTSITIPDGVTSIGESAFEGCSGLTSITIPNSVTTIGKYAIKCCSGLTSITIPNGVTSIDEATFYECSGLTSITIPGNVTTIGQRAFYGCSSLTDMFCYAENVPKTGNNVFNSTNIANATLHVPAASVSAYQATEPWKNFKEIVALGGETPPEDVDPDGNGLIDDVEIDGIYFDLVIDSKEAIVKSNPNKYQGNVTIPATVDYGGTTYSVTSIGERTFYDCSALTSITIPEGITSISNNTFAGCSGLTSITIPDGVTSIGNGAFSYCSGLTSVSIPNSVTSIREGTFMHCISLTSVTISDGVTSIGQEAFYDCISLTSVTIPDGVTEIGVSAFSGCSGLTSITLGSGVVSIGGWAFDHCCSLKSVTIPNGVISIGDYAFWGCSGLTSITIPDGVTSIGGSAFQDCSDLTSVIIGSGVTSIGALAFASCSGMSDLFCRAKDVPKTGLDVFHNCKKATLHVPSVSIEAYKAAEPWNQFMEIVALPAQEDDTDNFNYIPFVKDGKGKRWHVVRSELNSSHTEQYMLAYEDVVKDGKTYLKMYRSMGDRTEDQNMGLFREEDRKVYFIAPDMQEEHLMFDFSLKEGDTYETYSYDEEKMVSYEVMSVEDYLEGPEYIHYIEKEDGLITQHRYLRKWIVCRTDDKSIQKVWIEGVGSLEGPLGNLHDEVSTSARSYLAYVEDAYAEDPDYDNLYLPFTINDVYGHVHGCDLPTEADNQTEYDEHHRLTYELEGERLHVYGEVFGNCGPNDYAYFYEKPTDDPLVHKIEFEIQEVAPLYWCLGLHATDFYVSGFDPNLNYIVVDNQGVEHPVINKTQQMAYRPFVEDGKGWKVGYGSDNPIQFVEYYYFDSDTIIDGKVCKQMMCQRYVSPDYPEYDVVSQQPSLSYVGAWYEEDKKVYVYNTTDKQFKLMYDFSVDDNATLQIHGQSYVIGPKQTGGMKGFKGIYRDVMMPWDEEQSIYNTTWLEGVGGIEGPKFNVYLGKEYHGGAFLMSCTVGDEVIYLNDDYDDAATPEGARKRRFDFTHTIKIQPKARITRNRSGAESEESLYGEYNEQQLSIYLDPIDDTYLVSITSESGKPVYEKDINAGNIVGLNIDISSYAEGRYTVTVENSRESFTGEFGAGNSDVDGDGILTAKDIIAIINVISGKTTDEALKSAADVNGDGVVNIADIVKITNIMGQ